MSSIVSLLRARRLEFAAWAAVAVFAVMAGRFWHPCYGFTKFLQFDSTDAPIAIHEIRENPVYIYPGRDGYDGYSYAQIAFHPLLDSAELKGAIGNVPYRARRILGSAIAWLFAGGRPDRIAPLYAALNLGVWLVLAALAWRLLAVRDWRGWAAWAGLLFSAGALHSVRLALTDLLGVTLFAAAMLLEERRRRGWALAVLALSGLARETALLGIVALWRGPWASPRVWLSNALRTAAAAAPLAAWIAYVRWRAGPAPQGMGNLTWPVAGWIEKAGAVVGGFARDPDTLLNLATLLATAGLTVQAAYFIRRPRAGDAWWRAGAAGAGLMALLGTSVWEGHPGAATRVLLPMSLSFAVMAVRERAPLAWIVAGNLTVLSGVVALWHVPSDPRELAAGRTGGMAYVAQLAGGWYGCEQHKSHAWAWAPGNASLELRTWQSGSALLRARFFLRSLSPRTVEIRQGPKLLWRGAVGAAKQAVDLGGLPPGGPPLDFRTEEPPVLEGSAPGARELGICVYDLSLSKEAP